MRNLSNSYNDAKTRSDVVIKPFGAAVVAQVSVEYHTTFLPLCKPEVLCTLMLSVSTVFSQPENLRPLNWRSSFFPAKSTRPPPIIVLKADRET